MEVRRRSRHRSGAMTVTEAQKQGVQAYRDGLGKAPALNGAFTKAACASGRFTKMAEAYLYGWTIAMLADGAPEGTPSVGVLAQILAS